MKNISLIVLLHSTFDLKYFLKITGVNDRNENAHNINTELHENAIVELVILYSVFPP
jgi:hypothetical protein